MAANPWDNDPIVSAAPTGAPAAGNPWDNDPIVSAAPDADTPRVGWAEENLAGPSEVLASAIANIPHAAVHSAVNLYRRVSGGDTDAPDPAAVRAIEVPTGAGGRQLLSDITQLPGISQGIQGVKAADAALGRVSPTAQDVLHQTADVAGDIANIAPFAGIARGVAGKAISAAADAQSVANRVISKVADPSSPAGKALAKTAAKSAELSKPAAPAKPTFADDVPSPNTPPPDFTPPAGAPAASAAAPVTDAEVTRAITAAPAADDAAAQARYASLQRLKEDGLQNVRESAVRGDKLAAATDYASSKLDKGAGGNPVAEQLANERQALTNGVDRMIAGTGGSVGTDSVALGNRGETILRPLDDLAQKFRDGEKAAYTAADAKAAGSPVDLDSTANLISNNASVFTRSEAGAQLLRGIKARAQELGVWDTANNRLMPATVQQAEQLRQYVGGGAYDPHTAGAVRAFKDALADDVTKSAGSDVYQAARALRAQRARTLDDPKGIATLIDSSGPDGINRKVPVEKIPDTLTRLPDAQFNHVIDTIESTRQFPELKPQADAALAEIRGHMLQRAKAAALPADKEPWAAQRFTDYLQANRAKLTRVLKPSELEQLESLNRNGHYLDIDRRYKGAAVDAHNLATRGKMMIVQHGVGAAGGGAGAFVGGHVGAAGGAFIGEKLGHKWAAGIERAADRKAWAKRVRQL
jgi:hypothetical protein